jgi:propionate CoA-transferase
MLLTERTVIARRAALALRDGAVVNFGAGLSKAVAAVADAEGILDRIGSSVRRDTTADAAIDGPARFGSCGTDGVDQAFLDMAEVDRRGNVDVGRFGATTAGTGGIIDISQGAACVYFLGTFISGGQRIRIQGGALEIEREGTRRKFVDRVQRLTFNGACATERGQQIFYVTERAVFRLTGTGLELIEIAPGVQVEKHILRSMAFEPRIASNLRLMDGRIFRTERMVPGGMA